MSSRTTEGLLCLALAAAAGCHSTTGYHGRPTPLLERAWIAPSLDSRDSLLYEAQIAANIFLFDDLEERQVAMRNDRETVAQRSNRILVVPLFRMRQLRDSSAAVRTPSFNPSLRWERHFLSADTLRRTPGSRRRELRVIRDRGFRAEWTHHSNGQAGCFRSGWIPAPTGNPDDCIPGLLADTSRVALNRASGDFSTSYWGITGFVRHIALGRDSQEEDWVAEVALGYQLHRFALFGDMRPEQRALYGTHRVRLDASMRKDFGAAQGRVDALYERAEHTDGRITPWRAHLDLSVRFRALLGGGVMVRLLDGQDYYNIGFVQRRSRILLGVVLDPSGLEGPRGTN